MVEYETRDNINKCTKGGERMYKPLYNLQK